MRHVSWFCSVVLDLGRVACTGVCAAAACIHSNTHASRRVPLQPRGFHPHNRRHSRCYAGPSRTSFRLVKTVVQSLPLVIVLEGGTVRDEVVTNGSLNIIASRVAVRSQTKSLCDLQEVWLALRAQCTLVSRCRWRHVLFFWCFLLRVAERVWMHGW